MEEQPERRFGQGDLLSRLRPDLSGGLAAGLFSGLPTFIELPMTRSNTIVLVVDDKPAVAELLKFSLHEDEWIWHSVPSLAQAWDFIGRERPELLPKASAWPAKRLRRRPPNSFPSRWTKAWSRACCAPAAWCSIP